MSDLATWKVHGPVHSLRTEFAEWDLSLEQWKPPHPFTLVRFNPDGKVNEQEHHNPDGSVARSSYSYDAAGRLLERKSGMSGDPAGKSIYSYDESGLLARVVSVDPDGTERESEVCSYGADGRRTSVRFISTPKTNGTFTLVNYDNREQLDEVLFKDQNHHLIRRLTFARDAAGRLASEETHLGETELEHAATGDRERARAMFTKVFGAQLIMSSTSYSYDGKGRVRERRTRMGDLGGHRTTYLYDDHDNPIEETTEHTSREMEIDDEGNPSKTKGDSHTQTTRYEYTYDAQGNWTERVVRLSNVERREITYYHSERDAI